MAFVDFETTRALGTMADHPVMRGPNINRGDLPLGDRALLDAPPRFLEIALGGIRKNDEESFAANATKPQFRREAEDLNRSLNQHAILEAIRLSALDG